jgi:hypothetical protein
LAQLTSFISLKNKYKTLAEQSSPGDDAESKTRPNAVTQPKSVARKIRQNHQEGNRQHEQA